MTDCPALAILRGAMGTDRKGRPNLPKHRLIDGVCRHCQTTVTTRRTR